VQTLYQDAILVLAIGIATLIVAYLKGGLRRALVLLAPFCVAASSLLPYVGHLQEARRWSQVANVSAGNARHTAFLDALSSPTEWFVVIWVAVALLAIAGAIRGTLRKEGRGERHQSREHILLYCGITFAVSLAGFLLFFVYVAGSVSLQPWHFVPLLVLSAVTLTPLAEPDVRNTVLRACRTLVTTAAAALVLVPSARDLAMRMTSMDLTASVVGREARPDDLVIVNPWYLGISFSRYYRGSAPWTTFPSLQERTVHRYDLLKDRMRQPETIAEDIRRISATLQQGGKIWAVGQLEVNTNPRVSPLAPAPLSVTGWSSGPYLQNWSQHLTTTLAINSIKGRMVPVDTDRKVNPLESPMIAVFEGLR
ncbi:MAG TPA: hypothetical protein VE398_23465, partial [Acidobacteriota bacterium]|nr:hypothetical protein [Acidobacteriota bacterium]